MKCLNDSEVQSVVDREAPDDVRQHLFGCARCGDRVRQREKLTASVRQSMNPAIDLPAGASLRIERAIGDGLKQGATRLRGVPAPPPWRRGLWGAAAVTAATLLAIVLVAPLLKGPSTVSASEILARSATRLAQPLATGVEQLEYELTLAGVTREMMLDRSDGVYRVKQVIDHDVPGRYLVASYGVDGQLLSSVTQDPDTHQRVMTLRVDGQPYRFEFSVPKDVALSLPEMERLHMQASVAMMQASGDQSLQVIDTPQGRQYRIEVPHVSGETPNAVWDLADARVVIDASDYHVVEFAVTGTFLKQAYSVSYRLINRIVAAQVSPGAFEVPGEPGAITVRGEGTALPARDALVVALRELARTRQAR
jgi:hypothetical protein